jgi:TolB protein
VAGLSFAPASQAQIRFEITGVGASQIPVAITAFPGEEAAPQQITSVVKADLARSGIFKLIDNGDALSDSSAINYADWQKRGANALAVGSVTRLADGRFDVRYRSSTRCNRPSSRPCPSAPSRNCCA